MRFTLTYDGDLPSAGRSSGRVAEKWEIRKQFDPQLRRLWDLRPDLAELRDNPIFAKSGRYVFVQAHPMHPEAAEPIGRHNREIIDGREVPREHEIDLCAPIRVGPTTFVPLVRKSLALQCGLRILFLRQEPRGHIIQSGDIDNRIKTLFDALSVPNRDQICEDESVVPPIHCLLENDSLIASIDVRSEHLLIRPQAPQTEVRLVIEVDVRVSQPRPFNTIFLGD